MEITYNLPRDFSKLPYSVLTEEFAKIPSNLQAREYSNYNLVLGSLYRSLFHANPKLCGCSSQWQDVYVKLAIVFKSLTEEMYQQLCDRTYHINDNFTFRVDGKSYNELSITDEIAEQILANPNITDVAKKYIVKDDKPRAMGAFDGGGKRKTTQSKTKRKSNGK